MPVDDGVRFRLAVLGGLVIRLGIGIRFGLDASNSAIVGIAVRLFCLDGVRHIVYRLAVSMAIGGIRIRIRIVFRFGGSFRRLIAIRVGERVGGRGGGGITVIGARLFGFLLRLIGVSGSGMKLLVDIITGYWNILLECILVLDNIIGRHTYIQSLYNQSVFTLYDISIAIARACRSS